MEISNLLMKATLQLLNVKQQVHLMIPVGEISFLPNYHLKYFVLLFVIQKYEAHGRNQNQVKRQQESIF